MATGHPDTLTPRQPDTLTPGMWSTWVKFHHYTFFQGAFGSVRLAYKLEDRELVVTKFITVAKVEMSEVL